MTNEYNATDRIWRAPTFEHNYPNIGLGHSILENLKNTDPERIIEVEHETGASLTARQVRSQTLTVAQNLKLLGVKKSDIVIVFSRSNIKISPLTFASYTIGAAINFFILDLKRDDIQYYFDLLNPTAILYEDEFKIKVFQALENLKLSNLKHILSLDSEIESVLFKPIDIDIESFQLPDIGDPNKLTAVLLFTTGSTGRPKISTYTHAMLLQGVYNKCWHLEPKSIVCALSDLRWTSQVQIMLLPVFFDVKRIYTSKRQNDFDDAYVYELLHKHKITHYSATPTGIFQLLENAEKANHTLKLGHLRSLLVAGEAVTDSLIKNLTEIMPDCKIINSYGMTELHGLVATDEEVPGRSVNGGILKNGFVLRIIDEHGNHLGPNEKGRLCLKSIVPLIGYFKNEIANKELLKGDGWLTTADYGYMDSDHLLNVVTRYQYLLRLNGRFIVPTEIENIINNHKNVLLSALVGYPDPDSTDSDIGTIFVVPKNYSQRDGIEDELLTLLRKYLTKEQTQLVRYLKVIEKFPMCSAKVNRTSLKEMAVTESGNYLKIM